MGKLSSDEVGHGDEVFDAAIAAGAGSCLRKRPIHGFDPAMVFAGLEAIEDARKMLGNGPAEALEGFESAATGPTQPVLEEGPGLIRRRGFGIDRAQQVGDILPNNIHQSGSRMRLPASGPLRTVHASFDAHGSSLYEGILRHPVTQLNIWRRTTCHGN